MELKKILVGIENLKVKGNLEIDINSIKDESSKIEKGDLFVAIAGFSVDGHEYINDAIKKGAKAIMLQEDKVSKNMIKEIPEDVTIIVAKDTRYALAISACNYYENPSKKVILIGVTGTKGKTTTTYMIREILEKQNIKVGLIGTVASYVGKKKIADNINTTPGSLELQEILSKMIYDVIMFFSSRKINSDKVNFENIS